MDSRNNRDGFGEVRQRRTQRDTQKRKKVLMSGWWLSLPISFWTYGDKPLSSLFQSQQDDSSHSILKSSHVNSSKITTNMLVSCFFSIGKSAVIQKHITEPSCFDLTSIHLWCAFVFRCMHVLDVLFLYYFSRLLLLCTVCYCTRDNGWE